MVRFILITVTLGLLFSVPAGAQQRLGIEVRGFGALPTRDVGTTDLGTGFGFETRLRYRVISHVGVYGGWNLVHFSPDTRFAGADVDIDETGYTFGVHLEQPFSDGADAAIWTRVGGTYGHIELKNSEGEIVSDSGQGMGWEAGAGVEMTLGERWSFSSGLRYRSLSRDVEVDTEVTAVDLRYIAVDVGWALVF